MSSTLVTRNQKVAQIAFEKVSQRAGDSDFKEYRSFALSFPAMVHKCGLCQAIAFGQAKSKSSYLDDLVAAINSSEIDTLNSLAEKARTSHLPNYMQLTRTVLLASGWIKRYVECHSPKTTTDNSNESDSESKPSSFELES